jgi:pimeloyl-ACP methyl ester carboxylesterase
VVRVELPGFGSSPAGEVATLAGWAEVTVAVADVLGLERFALLGHSFGGGAALLAGALAGERLAGLVLLASMGGRRHRSFLLPCTAYAFTADLARYRFVWPPAAALARLAYRTNGLRPPVDDADLGLHMRLLGSVSFERLTAAARRVAAPALVIHAADDRLVEPDIARALSRELLHGTYIELDGGGHHLNRTRPGEVAGAVHDLLVRDR